MVDLYTPEQQAAVGFNDSMIDMQVQMLSSPWFVALLDFDPRPYFAEIRCPVLALNGKKDLQVAWQENLEGIRLGLEAGGNENVTLRALPDLNHLFQHCRTGALSEYGTIEETMSPAVLALVGDWISQVEAKNLGVKIQLGIQGAFDVLGFAKTVLFTFEFQVCYRKPFGFDRRIHLLRLVRRHDFIF